MKPENSPDFPIHEKLYPPKHEENVSVHSSSGVEKYLLLHSMWGVDFLFSIDRNILTYMIQI